MASQFQNLLGYINLPIFSMPNFGFNSIIDIFFIAFVIYKLLIWIRETKAWTLFKGITILLLVYFIAFFLSMDTTIWIIDSTLNVAVIAALIIFQPELRKALERLGNNRNIPFISNLGETDSSVDDLYINEISDALSRLSNAKTGALIVLEGQIALGDIAATGIKIDGIISSQLLINIFENKTPLHDGAVLIKQNKILAATCILPLTSENLSSELGTRHRAAVGISENSDAYAIVVSEETGAISIAKDGKLQRAINSADIIKILSKNSKKPSKKVFKRKKVGGLNGKN